MPKMQFFFDYECPYCKKGYEYLMEQIKDQGAIEIEWIPVEAHPRPAHPPGQKGEDSSADKLQPYTDLACQCYYIARELGADMNAFHAKMYQAASIERQNVEKPEVLCGILKGIVDAGKLCSILESGKYAKQIYENNDLAYEKSGVWYVPAFRMNGKKLDAKGGVGITQKDLRDFLKG